ncbi:hypothetical protein AAV35_013630 [Salimicrobium jeotgali]|uniref:DUF3862 domain-containing protein n=1 Tax=Salimicrobium jeotgali TaxID=1230341 RepID=K2H6S9_9BACI|nr:DUF3862 domain-containing protein [Salimicrobium jeotgali]AKG03301.1 hypothetical protein AAV35_013630 [Salimicrobium jeotgali]EKE31460.1 hypothetical protein MJ3_08035 [Salimicrobium jeotgali]MBM7696749.1 putative dehydrogenase [Salimicrobium jeotgali]
MKKFFKFGCLGIIGIIVLGTVIAALGGGDSTENTSSNEENQTETTSEKQSQENDGESQNQKNENQSEENTEQSSGNSTSENTSSKNDETISAEEFDQISNGMSYEKVVEIIGSEGSLQSETGEKGTQFHTVIYSWDGESGFGSNAMLTFQNEKLQSKSQAGVGDGRSSDVTITSEEFNQIENGMSSDEVFEIIGGEGEITSESGEPGSQFYTVSYTYSGEAGLGSNATLMFQGGKLSSKSQFGLE